MKAMKKNSNGSVFPPQEEFERVVERISKNEGRTNIGLSANASPVEKAKYKLCKSILGYKQENSLKTKDVAKQLGLTVAKTEKILYSHIDELSFEELANYVNNLHVPCQLKINIPYGRKETATETH